MNKKISFIGLGAMGGPMAINILKKGIKLSVFDIDEVKLEKVVGHGGIKSKNINDCINNSKIVITMLPATDHVKKVMLGEEGIIKNFVPGSIIMDMST